MFPNHLQKIQWDCSNPTDWDQCEDVDAAFEQQWSKGFVANDKRNPDGIA